MPGLRDILNANGQFPQTGGCWRLFGGRNGTSGAYNGPVSLEVSGVGASYTVLQIIPGGDNPNITDWICQYRYISFLYGCTSSTPGCLCPGGECPASTLYVFDTNGCCCLLPCDGDAKECTFSHDFGHTISVPTSDTFSIYSFFLNGVQYVTSPIPLDPPNIISIGGQSYNTAFADTINGIGVPNFLASYPTLAEITSAHAQGAAIHLRNNIVRFEWPLCYNFQIIVEDEIGTVYTWTQAGYTGQNAGLPYGFPLPIDCQTFNNC